MSYSTNIDAGQTVVVKTGTPIRYVSNDGPGVLLIEGEVRGPGTGWSPKGYTAWEATVTALDLPARLGVQ